MVCVHLAPHSSKVFNIATGRRTVFDHSRRYSLIVVEFVITVFWVMVIYHLLLFPMILLFSASLKGGNRIEKHKSHSPTVSLLIAARNEENSIAQKIENSLSLDYPGDKLRIFILANGCTDNTVMIASRYLDRDIEIFEYDDIGKTHAQNLAVEKLDSDIIVFSDANTPYNKQAIKRLVAPFADPSVGCTNGRHVYVNLEDATGATEGTYWNIYENFLKRAESKTSSMLGANGAIYAVRRELYIPLPPDVIPDLFEPLLLTAKGYRTVYTPEAKAFERSELSFEAEYRRKVRIVRRSVSSLLRYRWLLDPRRTGRLALILWSHKVLRWLTPLLLIAIVAGSLAKVLFNRHRNIDLFVLFGASIFGFAVLLGRGLGHQSPVPLLSHAYYLFTMFRAAITGIWEALTEGGILTWDHDR